MAVIKSDWFITDDDCLQCCKPLPEISSKAFEFTQIIGLPGHVDGKPFWVVARADISVADYSDEDILSALNFFGYDDMNNFVSQNSPEGRGSDDSAVNYQLIAEMLFEIDALPHYGESEHASWNAAVERVAQITGLDLSSFLERDVPAIGPADAGPVKKKSLTDRIQEAENRPSSTGKDAAVVPGRIR